MLSFIEHVVAVTEVRVSADHRASQSRSGGPGDDRSEKERHAKKVRELRGAYQDKKLKGFRSPEERRLAADRHRLARRSEGHRHRKSMGGQ
jgi:hypothetical protein